MVERIIISTLIVGAGIAAYLTALAVQRRLAGIGAMRETRLERAALLVFTSPTCGPCKLQQMPIVNRLMPDWGDRIELRVVDVAEQPGVAAQYSVWSVPTTIVLDAHNSVVAINQGVASERNLGEQLTRAHSRLGIVPAQ